MQMTLPPAEVLWIQLGIALTVLTLYFFARIIVLRITIKDKVGCFFEEATGRFTFELIKYKQDPGDANPVLISHDMGYGMDVNSQVRIDYPLGSWRWLQESIPCQCYVRGYYFPINWRKRVDTKNPGELAVMMKNAKNTSFATSVIANFAGRGSNKMMKNLQTAMMGGMLILGVGLVAVGYLSYQNYKAMGSFQPAVERIDRALSK